MSVAARLVEVQARIAAATARAKRPAGSVRLVAVSKLQPASLIREAYAAGQRDFGENYAQELRDKAAELADLPGLVWHAIGGLQRNKAKYVAKAAAFFHALDREDVARELSARRQGMPPLACLLEVNVAHEEGKAGASLDAAPALFETLRALPNLSVVGLTCLPPLEDDPERTRPHFRALRQLGEALGVRELSMGTTGDFEVAIEEGATWVRVGTAIFGDRPAKAP
jgi:pyridoxal phosphate enzyme (YggS family)